MELKDIAAIAGKPGLYRVVKPTYNGLIVETLDEKKRKMSVGAAHRVSILKEVSIYTNDQEGSMPLGDILQRIHTEYAGVLPVDAKSNKDELQGFLEKMVPEYDRDRVYPSDIKKLISWYNILFQQFPDTLEEILKDKEPEEPAQEEIKEETKAEEKGQVEEKKTQKTGKKDTPEVKAKDEPVPQEEKPAPKKKSPKKTTKASPSAEKLEEVKAEKTDEGKAEKASKTASKAKPKTTSTRKKKTSEASADAGSEAEMKTEKKPKTPKKTKPKTKKKETDA